MRTLNGLNVLCDANPKHVLLATNLIDEWTMIRLKDVELLLHISKNFVIIFEVV
jgi:hypothetical protein